MTRAWSLFRGVLLGLAAFALASHLLLLLGTAVPHWLAPLLLLAGLASSAITKAAPEPIGPKAPRWLAIGCALALAVLFGLLVYGAVATGDREWDGVAAWGLKARALLAEPSLQQPLFSNPSAYLHTADYPLLQPLLLASSMHWLGEQGGRILFPLLWLAMSVLCGMALSRNGADRRVAWLATLAFAATPEFVTPGSGAVDSGYAELLVALLLTAAGAGLLLGDALLLGAAACCLPLAKPEGTVYFVLLAAVTMLSRSRRNHRIVVIAGAAALLLWLPVRTGLVHGEAGGPWLLAVAVLAGLAIAMQELILRRSWWTAGGVAAGAAFVLGYLASTGTGQGALSGHLQGFGNLGAKLARTPEILGGLLTRAAAPGRFGFLFPLLAALMLWPHRRRCPSRAPGALLALGLLAVASAFFLSPETSVQHNLKSSASRWLQQWCGVGWLLAGVWLGRQHGQPQESGMAPRPPSAEGGPA